MIDMVRKGIDTTWKKIFAGRYESNDGRFIERENGEWWGYNNRGEPESVFQTLKEALRLIWK